MKTNNIFTQVPKDIQEELFEDIISKDNIKIQRIISNGHTTQEFDWYDQDNDEWVMLLQGEAIISFEDKNDVKLVAGDYINIPAHKKHKVSWTIPNKKTIWLAVHY